MDFGTSPLDSRDAQAWVDFLRSAVNGNADAPETLGVDQRAFIDAVDELASWLYWREPASV